MLDAGKLGLWIAAIGLAVLIGGLIYWGSNQPVTAKTNASTNSNPWLADVENAMAAMSASDENLYRRHRRSKANTYMIIGGVVGLLGVALIYSTRRKGDQSPDTRTESSRMWGA